MLAIKGIYDGNNIIPIENITSDKKFKVVITFIEEINDDIEEEIRKFYSQTDSFTFWDDPKENIYQDFL